MEGISEHRLCSGQSRVRFRTKWNNQKGPLISDHLTHSSDSSTTTGSHRVRRGSGQWGESKHSSCSGLWSGSRDAQEHCFSLTPASISHLPDTARCPLLLCLKATTASAVICSVTPCPGEGTARQWHAGSRGSCLGERLPLIHQLRLWLEWCRFWYIHGA